MKLLAWILPGWESAHDMTLLSQYSAVPEQVIADVFDDVRKSFNENKDSEKMKNGNAFFISLDGSVCAYQFLISKMKHYDPTFMEEFGFARRSKFDVQLVMNSCAIHGTPERVARIFEVDQNGLNFFDNAQIHDFLRKVLNYMEGSDQATLQDKAFYTMYYETGLRRDELLSSKVGDLDLKKKVFRSSL